MADPTKPLYPLKAVLRHKVRGSTHVITGLPDKNRIEDGWRPAYMYTCGDITTMREQSEMEDGRFERIDVVEMHPPCVTVVNLLGATEYHGDGKVVHYPNGRMPRKKRK